MSDVLFGRCDARWKDACLGATVRGPHSLILQSQTVGAPGFLGADVSRLYAFGYGLSYTTFALSNVRLTEASIDRTGSTTVVVDVKNTGARAGSEVVQVYVRDVVSSVTRPVKELKAFSRVRVAAGEMRTVSLTLGPDAFACHDVQMKHLVKPGEFRIMVGTSSRDCDLVTLSLRVA